MNKDNFPDFLIRLGISFAFLYPAISGFFDPTTWIGYFPSFMRGIVPDSLLLGSFELIEIILALWILSGKKIFLPSALATIMLISIVLFNHSDFEVLFRDVSLAAVTLSLALKHKRYQNTA